MCDLISSDGPWGRAIWEMVWPHIEKPPNDFALKWIPSGLGHGLRNEMPCHQLAQHLTPSILTLFEGLEQYLLRSFLENFIACCLLGICRHSSLLCCKGASGMSFWNIILVASFGFPQACQTSFQLPKPIWFGPLMKKYLFSLKRCPHNRRFDFFTFSNFKHMLGYLTPRNFLKQFPSFVIFTDFLLRHFLKPHFLFLLWWLWLLTMVLFELTPLLSSHVVSSSIP